MMQTKATDPSYAATIAVKINAFYPIGSIYPINASLTLTAGDTNVFNFADDSLIVTVPPGMPVTISYVLQDPHYVLLGIAFNPNGPGAGRQEFPQVMLNRTSVDSTMTVTDASLSAFEGVTYNYVILVQEVATGNIGLIDPDIENEPD